VDPNIHVDADSDPDSDPDWYQYDADPQADPTPSFIHFVKSDFFFTSSQLLPVYNVLSFSSMSNVSQFSVFCTAY
jgi:hypothetical protein